MKTTQVFLQASAYSVALLSLTIAQRSASANVKIVSTVTVTGGSAATPNGTTTYTTLYKGRKARLESSDGVVILYDCDADKVYTLRPAEKTYFIQSFKDALKTGTELPEALKERLSVTTQVELAAAKDAPDTPSRTIAGHEAAPYSVFSTVGARPKTIQNAGAGGFAGGGRGGPRGGGAPGGRGGGGFGRGTGSGGMPPGGGPGAGGGTGNSGPGSGGPGGPTASQSSLMTLSGDFWVGDAEKILPGGKKDEKEMALALVRQTLPPGNPALEAVADRLSKKHLLPLESRLSVRAGRKNSTAPVSNTAGATPPAVPVLVVRMQVTAIETNTSLPDTLFQLPGGYDRIEPVASPLAVDDVRSGPPDGASGPPPAP